MSTTAAPSPTTGQCDCEDCPAPGTGQDEPTRDEVRTPRTRLASARDSVREAGRAVVALHGRPGWVGVAVRIALVALVGLVAAAIHVPRPATICPLRALTGIPCPLCGSTTAGVELGSGDVLGALRANPIAVLVGGLWVLGPLGVSRLWWNLPGRRHLQVIAALLAIGWVWQLFRFDLL